MGNFQEHPGYSETEEEALKFEVGFVKKANEQLQAEIERLNTIIDNRAEDLEVKTKYDKLQAKVETLEKVLNSSLLKFSDFSMGARQEPSFEQYVKTQAKRMAEQIEQALKANKTKKKGNR